jgi:hypothetical protein
MTSVNPQFFEFMKGIIAPSGFYFKQLSAASANRVCQAC